MEELMDDLEKRVQDFNLFALPGQVPIMHMGTSYLVNDLWREVQRLRDELRFLKNIKGSSVIDDAVKELQIPKRLMPLMNIAKELPDEDIDDCVQYVAYLNYRRRVFKMAKDTFGENYTGK
jgi:hypothetical protein